MFKMKIVGFYKRPLQRRTIEGLLIGEASEGTLMNRRGEWGQNLPPKLEIEDPELLSAQNGKSAKTPRENQPNSLVKKQVSLE